MAGTNDVGAGGGEHAHGFETDPLSNAGNQNRSPAQVNVSDNLRGGGFRAERAFRNVSQEGRCAGAHSEPIRKQKCGRKLQEIPTIKSCRIIIRSAHLELSVLEE